MSKFLIDKDDLFRVKAPDGEWIDIKVELSQKEVDYVTSMMAKPIEANEDEGRIFNLGKLALLEVSIKYWSFQENDKPLPLSSENICNLKTKYRVLILQEIDRLQRESLKFEIPK